MITVKNQTQITFREKGSKFIGHLFPASTTKQFDQKLDEIKSTYPDATHHCYGWRINPAKIEEFAQDDGEPGGTAGLPILNKLKSFEVVNCGCVVVRYYGGTNLGKSGLIQAYGQAAKQCLEQASRVKLIPTKNFEIIYPYDQQKRIDQIRNDFDLKEIEAEYLENVTLHIACRAEQADNFSASLEKLGHQGIQFEEKGEGFVTI